MHFDHVSMVRTEMGKGKKVKFGIRFSKKGETSEIYTSNFLLFTTWKRLLATRLIQNTFHEDFEIVKMIGKGNFARVRIIELILKFN